MLQILYYSFSYHSHTIHRSCRACKYFLILNSRSSPLFNLSPSIPDYNYTPEFQMDRWMVVLSLNIFTQRIPKALVLFTPVLPNHMQYLAVIVFNKNSTALPPKTLSFVLNQNLACCKLNPK